MSKHIRLVLLSGLVCASALAACSPKTPWLMEDSHMTPAPITLAESRHIVKKPLADMTSNDIANAANAYRRGGAGPMYVVVAYKEQGKSHALDQKAADISTALQSNGMEAADIVSSTVPLDTDTPVVLIAFDTLEARGPEDCTGMPGLDRNPGMIQDYDYKLGCGVKSMIAKQIANPADLEGHAGLGGHNDGERAANIVTTTYRTGETREFLPSYIISELAGSGSK